MNELLNIDSLRTTLLNRAPFPYAVVNGFVRSESLGRILGDFPHVPAGGSFPLAALSYGDCFKQLCHELRGPEVREAFAEKFQIDLRHRPTTLTVRGCCRKKDGRIHTDSRTKLITVLIYLNEAWNSGGGRLRILRNGTDINDYVEEVPPTEGTLLCFRNGPTAWHGHTSFEGIRRTIQLNWVTGDGAVRTSQRRHRFSSMVKRINQLCRVSI